MDDDDFLAAVEADNSTPETEPVKVEVEVKEEPKPEPEKAESEVLVLETPAEPLEPPVVETPKAAEPGFVPIAAMLDARDRAKAAEARLAQIQQAQQQQQFQMPDPYEDPQGFAAVQEAKVGQALYQTNLRWSERIASIQHGEETVNAAKQWGFQKCEADPYFNARVAASPDPLGLVVSEYKREEIASKVTPQDFEQFQAWKAAQSQLTQQAAPAVPSTQTSAIPPPSIASAPSAGNILTEPNQSDEDMFNEVIGNKR